MAVNQRFKRLITFFETKLILLEKKLLYSWILTMNAIEKKKDMAHCISAIQYRGK